MSITPLTLDEVMPQAQGPDTGPLITVVVPLNFPDMGPEERELVRQFTSSALTTLVELGARIRVVDVSHETPLQIDDDTDGLILLGGGDVDPLLYGHTEHVPNLYGVDRGIDERTLEALDLGFATGAPVFGICRGSQMINLALGGTLVPDLGPDNVHRGGDGEPMFLDDSVTVSEGSRLHAILNKAQLMVRNGHHQAVKDVGTGLRATAYGVDGVVEGIEHLERWIVGVQWHPEDDDGSADDRTALFRAFVDRATEHAVTKAASPGEAPGALNYRSR